MEEDATWGVPSSQNKKQDMAYCHFMETKIYRSKTLENERETKLLVEDLVEQTATRGSYTQQSTSMIRWSQDQNNSIFEPIEIPGVLSSYNAEISQEVLNTQELLKGKQYNGVTDIIERSQSETNKSADLHSQRKSTEDPEIISLVAGNKENISPRSELSFAAGDSNHSPPPEKKLIVEVTDPCLIGVSTQIIQEMSTESLIELTPLENNKSRKKKLGKKRGRRPSTTGDLIYTEGVPKGKRNRRAKDSGYFVEIANHYETPLLLSPADSKTCEWKEVSDSDIDLGGSVSPFKRRMSSKSALKKETISKDLSLESGLIPCLRGLSPDALVVPEEKADKDAGSKSFDSFREPSSDKTPPTLEIDTPPIPIISTVIEKEKEKQQEQPLVKRQSKAVKKTLAEICASTSTAYFKPRVGLSRKSNIESLHGYLKKK